MFITLQSEKRCKKITPCIVITELVGAGRVDIFVVAVLTGLVQMGELMSILPGPAGVSLLNVKSIILTMLAAKMVIWNHDYYG